MPNGDPWDGFFYPILTLIMYSYIPWFAGKPRDAKRWSSGWIFIFHSHAHDNFLYSLDIKDVLLKPIIGLKSTLETNKRHSKSISNNFKIDEESVIAW